MSTTEQLATRNEEILESLAEIRSRVEACSTFHPATLIAVSKYKPASDLQTCFAAGQLDFRENYVQELEDKAKAVIVLDSPEIRWHFIGTLQSNKAKVLAGRPRTAPLNILIQINTSGEDSKSGLGPLSAEDVANAEGVQLARHIIKECPRLRLQGLMTIGALEQSLADADENADFERLKGTRDVLARALTEEFGVERWGEEGGCCQYGHVQRLDFGAALKAGSDIVRVGTGIFGARAKK
ncbi:hypothetical protein K438DRAFT_1939469 [Mycena galopus ATCC 62051]|nr:hypothetical protein K438DRAFT_1939469 [Mycena galopus ATCC 62051]